MKPRTVRRLRAEIEKPGYYRERCFQMCELSGFYDANALLSRYGVDGNSCGMDDAHAWRSYNAKSAMYQRRADWYARKAFFDKFKHMREIADAWAKAKNTTPM